MGTTTLKGTINSVAASQGDQANNIITVAVSEGPFTQVTFGSDEVFSEGQHVEVDLTEGHYLVSEVRPTEM